MGRPGAAQLESHQVGPGHLFNQGIPPMGPTWSFFPGSLLLPIEAPEKNLESPKNKEIGVGLKAQSRVIEGAKELHRHRHCHRPSPVARREGGTSKELHCHRHCTAAFVVWGFSAAGGSSYNPSTPFRWSVLSSLHVSFTCLSSPNGALYAS